jgi:hypothetical protein
LILLIVEDMRGQQNLFQEIVATTCMHINWFSRTQPKMRLGFNEL